MDLNELTTAMQNVKLPRMARERIVKNCRAALKNRVATPSYKRPLAALAALAVCLCLAGTAAAIAGHFQDVKNWVGTVIGTVYEQADDEIAVSAAAEDSVLTVMVRFTTPDLFPYRAIETIEIDSYQILDEDGGVLAEGADVSASVSAGEAVIRLPIEALKPGRCRLVINGFTGGAKAEQPLPIPGTWEAEFLL